MEKEKEIQIGIEVAKTYSQIINPWTLLKLEPPLISVKEISRAAGVSDPAAIAGVLARNEIIFSLNGSRRSLILVDDEGNQIEDLKSLTRAARKAAPYQRAVRETRYWSTEPGGGPVVKRRVDEGSLKQKLDQF